MNLYCTKCGSNHVIYGFKEHPQNGDTWWVFECQSCGAIWRPASWRNEPPVAVNDAQFESVIDEVRTALACECSCPFAPCFHTGIREIVRYEVKRRRERARNGNEPEDFCQKCAEPHAPYNVCSTCFYGKSVTS